MIVSKASEYAIQALLYLAEHEGAQRKRQTRNVGLAKISHELGIPRYFLGRILLDLVKKEIISSKKGPNGGFKLKMNPECISLLLVIEAIDGLSVLDRCAIGVRSCSSDVPCPIHESFHSLMIRVRRFLTAQTIASMLRSSKNLRSVTP